MTQEAGFQLGKRFYTFPAGFRLGDPVLVEQLTGLSWAEFVQRLPDDDVDQTPDDPVVTLGLIGVAVSQAHETWRRDRVVNYVSGLNMESVEFLGGEEDEPEEEPANRAPGDGDARPPVGSNNSERSPAESKPEPESLSVVPTPVTSGAQTSDTSPA